MKTLKIYFLLMLLIQTISISAQSVISGKITNNDSSPIVGATILSRRLWVNCRYWLFYPI